MFPMLFHLDFIFIDESTSVCSIFALFVRKYLQVRFTLKSPFLIPRCLSTTIFLYHLFPLLQTFFIVFLLLFTPQFHTTIFQLMILFFQTASKVSIIALSFLASRWFNITIFRLMLLLSQKAIQV